MCILALKGACILMRSNWKKTIAGITAIATLSPCCLGTVAYAAPQSAGSAVAVAEVPTLEEPLPASDVAAQIAADVESELTGSIAAESTPEQIPMPNYAEDDEVVLPDGKPTQDGKLYYKIVSKKAQITGCAPGTTDLVIPETIYDEEDEEEYPVTFIAASAFYGNKEIQTISFPETMVGIGANAFLGCTSLTSVEFPDSVASINASAFCSCSNLKSVKLPASLYFVGNDVFAYCASLESVTIPSNLTSIGSTMFANCAALKSVTMEEGVQSIGANAFYGCSALETVNFPEDSLTRINANAFTYSGLTSLELPNSVTNVATAAFSHCQNLKTAKLS